MSVWSVRADGLDGPATARMLVAGFRALLGHREELNRLNVFPIPDADTGTNMGRTVEPVLALLGTVPGEMAPGQVLRQVARQTLINARGNSGVILAEVFRGLASAVGEEGPLHPLDMIGALARARDYAYQAVADPVEGTILTALRAAAEAVGGLAGDARVTMGQVWQTAAAAAFRATEDGPRLLAVLRQHGVVDAAARGLTVLFEGMADELGGGEAATPDAGVGAPTGPHAEAAPAAYGYEVQLLLETACERQDIHRALNGWGESLVVTGGSGLFRIHIHSHRPEGVLAACRALGATAQETVDSLDQQVHGRDGAPNAHGDDGFGG